MGIFSIAAVTLGIYIVWILLLKPKKRPLPPGPKGIPIIGNLYDLPPEGVKEWEFWHRHKDLYGPISSLTLLGQPIIIMNTKESAVGVLEKNSIRTSTRPRPVFAYEFSGWAKTITLCDWKVYRLYRKAISKVIGSRAACRKFNEMQDIEATRFLWRTLQKPKEFANHFKMEAGAFILKMTYGYNINPYGTDPLVTLVESSVDRFADCAQPGNWLVNSIPSLRYIPEWFPGGGFKKEGRAIARFVTDLVDTPLGFTRYQKSHNSHSPSFVSNLIDSNEDEDIIRWTSMAMYMAGADTTVSSLKAFLLALLTFPEVQQKAQAEIDSVVGKDRLPTLADRDNLPYLEAMLKEVHRWHTVAPMGLTHQADEEFTYEGYLIPKGAYLMANTWFCNNDPKIHPNPRKFSPERFLESEDHEPESDPHEVSFGFGRRICPGRFLADTAIFVNMAQILAAYNVTKAVGPNGEIIEPNIEFTGGFVSQPVPFECTFTLRSAKMKEVIIQMVEKDHPFEESDAPTLLDIKVDYDRPL